MDELARVASGLEESIARLRSIKLDDPSHQGRLNAGIMALNNGMQTLDDILADAGVVETQRHTTADARGVDLAGITGLKPEAQARKPERGPVEGNALVGKDQPQK